MASASQVHCHDRFLDVGLPISGQCALHRAANFYRPTVAQGPKVAEDGDVYAFYFPAIDGHDKPVLGGGEFVTAFADRPEVPAFQAYLSEARRAIRATTSTYASVRNSTVPPIPAGSPASVQRSASENTKSMRAVWVSTASGVTCTSAKLSPAAGWWCQERFCQPNITCTSG